MEVINKVIDEVIDKEKKEINPRRFSVAPMLDWTTRHCRVFHRLLSKEALLYTEMITTGAILHAKYDHLIYSDLEHPVVLQLGGSNPAELQSCAKIIAERGYDQINLNVGCPSDRVQNGKFGACLMAEPELVADCVSAMKSVVNIPVTVKTRIGIDNQDSYEFLTNFISTIQERSGCDEFIIHARKAWLSGLSPKENRDIPPLDYQRVYQLKRDFPELYISINGGINDLQTAHEQLNHVDGVMLGRAVYQNPELLLDVDSLFFGVESGDDNAQETRLLKKINIIEDLFPYIEHELKQGTHLNHITRHILGLFQGVTGAKQWRRYLSENAHKPNAGVEVVEAALNFLR